LLGWGWQQVLHPDEVAIKLERWAESLKTGHVFEIEYRLRRFDGLHLWHLGRALPYRDEHGQIVRWFGTSTDIEAQKEAERALRDSQLALERHVAERTAELTRANEEISLLHSISMEMAAAEDLTGSLEVVLRRVCEKTGWAIGQAWVAPRGGDSLECSPAWFATAPGLEPFRVASQGTRLRRGVGLPGRVWASGQPAWIRDVTLDANFPRNQAAVAVGLKGALAIPIAGPEGVVAVIEFFVREPRQEDEHLTKVITTIATQLDLVLERKQAEETLRAQDAMLRASLERIQDLAGRLIIAQEAERRRIARELHDDISQQLAMLSLALSELKRRFPEQVEAALQDAVAALQRRALDLGDGIRRLSHDLHPGVLQQVGLIAALESHCEEFQTQHQIQVTLDAAGGGLDPIAPETALCLFRSAQEALRNAVRHGGARRIQVTLSRADGELALTIADDGCGFEAGSMARGGGGLGLLSIEERARLLRGSVCIESRKGAGTTVRVFVPQAGAPLTAGH
jgi:signal transduction histidine kinase